MSEKVTETFAKKVKKRGREEECPNLSWLLNFSAAKLFKPCQGDIGHHRVREPRMDPRFNKPGLTYTEMIEKALLENGRLTVAEIYKWIQSKYPYFEKDDPRWKNSVRHNLSINPQFRKGSKCDGGGSGHYWSLNKDFDDKFKKWQEDKTDSTAELDNLLTDDEVHRATLSILEPQDHRLKDNYCSDFLSSPMRKEPTVQVEFLKRSPWEDDSPTENFDPILADSILFSDTANLTLQSFDLFSSRI